MIRRTELLQALYEEAMYALASQSTTFLDGILSPKDLKKLSVDQLKSLSAEIRQEIVSNLNKTGGHLASNLGIVETTLGLHYVFNSPQDKILWDVGHQTYVHKMLTGRRMQFDTLRRHKGLSGFVNPLESEHDSFVAGHSSTSISLAVGMAMARDHRNESNKVIAVIGDGGLTGGMALEAINHLGHLQKDVIIILNDNEMSISENVGGISQYMKRIKETFFYQDIKLKINHIEEMLDEVPLSPEMRDMIELVKRQAKDRLHTPGIVFEKLGINYSGPIDGHDVGALIKAFSRAKHRTIPQIIHVVTQKGKGFRPAEENAIKYHGVTAFSLEPPLSEKIEPVAVAKPKAKTYSDVFSEALIEIAAVEPAMVAITPATAEGSGLVKFGKVYPERFYDVAICEQHAVTMAAGMAKAGLKPVVSIYSTFLQRAIDQVIHDVAILKLPVIFAIDRGGLVEDGETHQGVFDIAMLRTIPGFTILAPKDASDLRDMLYTAITEGAGPVAIRYPRDKAINAEQMKENRLRKIELTKWQWLSTTCDSAPNPNKIALVAFGAMVNVALEAKQSLDTTTKDVSVIYAQSAKPLDDAVLTEIFSGGFAKVVTLEEGCLTGGFGSAVLEWAARRKVKSPQEKQPEVACLGIPDQFIEHGQRPILLSEVGLTPAKVAEFVGGWN